MYLRTLKAFQELQKAPRGARLPACQAGYRTSITKETQPLTSPIGFVSQFTISLRRIIHLLHQSPVAGNFRASRAGGQT
jgi:hypothetical protein